MMSAAHREHRAEWPQSSITVSDQRSVTHTRTHSVPVPRTNVPVETDNAHVHAANVGADSRGRRRRLGCGPLLAALVNQGAHDLGPFHVDVDALRQRLPADAVGRQRCALQALDQQVDAVQVCRDGPSAEPRSGAAWPCQMLLVDVHSWSAIGLFSGWSALSRAIAWLMTAMPCAATTGRLSRLTNIDVSRRDRRSYVSRFVFRLWLVCVRDATESTSVDQVQAAPGRSSHQQSRLPVLDGRQRVLPVAVQGDRFPGEGLRANQVAAGARHGMVLAPSHATGRDCAGVAVEQSIARAIAAEAAERFAGCGRQSPRYCLYRSQQLSDIDAPRGHDRVPPVDRHGVMRGLQRRTLVGPYWCIADTVQRLRTIRGHLCIYSALSLVIQ